MIPETLLPLSTARNPSPLSLERRLGVAGMLRADDEGEEEGEEEGMAAAVRRALNKEGLRWDDGEGEGAGEVVTCHS